MTSYFPLSGLKALLFSTLLIHSIWSASAAAVAEELEGKFQHMAAEGDRIMAGAPKTLAQCAGTDASLDNSTAASIAYYARVAPLTILAESGDYYSVTPTHPSCLGLSNPWVKQPGHLLTRRCGTAWLTIAAIEESEATDTELEIKAGVTVTIAYADGSYCTTHLSKQKADSESPVASATTWGYAIIGVGISSVISLMGICLLICHRRVVQNYMKELLALSAGTFIGSVIFSLLPETGLELGMDVKITSVIFGGILFGMLSETVIHGMVGWFAKKPPNATASSRSLGPDPASPDQGTELIEVAPAMQRSSSLNTSPDNQTVIGIDCAAPCTDIQFASESLLGPNEDACTAVPDTTMPNLPSNIESSIAQTPSAMSKPNEEETSLQKLPSVEDDENHHHHHVRRRASDKKTNYHDDLEGLHGHGHSHTRGDSLAEARHAALINTIADALHNFIDGALIGATFLVNPATGWTTTAAVALHELPQEICDFALLTNAGLTGFQAALVNLLTSLTAFLGAIIAISVGEKFAFEVTNVLPFSVGLFTYLALAVLMPEILRVTGRKVISVWLAFATGIGLMAVQLALPWGHSHGGGEDSGSEEAHGHSHGRR